MNQQFDILAVAGEIAHRVDPSFGKSPQQKRRSDSDTLREKHPFYSLAALVILAFDDLLEELEEDKAIDAVQSVSQLITGIYVHMRNQFPGLMVYIHCGRSASWEVYLGPRDQIFVGQDTELENEVERILTVAMRHRDAWVVRS